MRRSLVVSLVSIVTVAVAALAFTLAAGNRPQLGLDLQGGASVVLKPTEEVDDGVLDTTIGIIRNRIDALGVAEPEISRQGSNILVELPGVKDQRRALEIVGQTAQLVFRPVLQDLPADPEAPVVAPPTTPAGPTDTTVAEPAPDTTVAGETTDTTVAPVPTTVLPTTERSEDDPTQQVVLPELDDDGNVRARYLLGPAGATGQAVETAAARFDPSANEWTVQVTFRSGDQGIDAFNRMAADCYFTSPTCPPTGQDRSGNPRGRIAIVLDSVVKSAPQILTPSFERDQVQISGGFTEREAKDLALVLRFGALPVQLEPQAVQTVSATLGKDSLRAGVVAGLIGLLLVVGYMLLYYRALGLMVVAGLGISGALLWSIISYLGETRGLALTLAGATGIIVSIGVTVDSYVVYFERLKEDVRAGKTLRSSAERGFAGAWRTILSADTVSLMGAFLLWWLSVGSVRGFAFFLGLATLLDMVVAYFFTRPAVALVSRSKRFSPGKAVLGVQSGEALVPVGATR